MTDLIARSDSEHTAPTQVLSAATAGSAPESPEPEVRWAPAPPPRKKRRLGLWIGIPVGVVALGAAAASLVLVAPGTTVGGVSVGLLTQGAAADAIRAQFAATTATIGAGGPTLTAAELGASIDADALASAVFEQRPLWNVGQWFGDPLDAPVTIAEDEANDALREALPALYTDPTPAAVAFDGTAYAVTPAVDGQGIDLASVVEPLHDAFAAGEQSVTVEPATAAIASPTTTEIAQQTSASLNELFAQIGFYVGDERTVPVDPATAASWITLTTEPDGSLSYTADATKIQAFVDGLKPLVDREPVAGTVIINSSNEVIDTITESVDGRVLGDTTGVAQRFADQLAAGTATYDLPVEVTPAVAETLHRVLEVDLTNQMLYMKENGVVVDSFLVSTGLPGADTPTGDFRVWAHVREQTMSGWQTALNYAYEIPNVQFAMYFDNNDNAFHGVYWRDNWGERGSNGCVGMPDWRAEQIYYWSPDGIDVKIYH
ncbi:L,D-transpeptidase family protein [Microbacterium sp. No. 7]|uniref:L,D-transpeptidase family protein n=1 Tax=Microbacterium sp. No. 7 TaxID=1714373 RepID=UPI0006CFCB3A|nr:L,D-transpeptidase family protein [Microbacterium sp. No. 7]ALJ19185.1 hypothetical protein AOA12_04415 [Microbacterium sp. No. 7]